MKHVEHEFIDVTAFDTPVRHKDYVCRCGYEKRIELSSYDNVYHTERDINNATR